MLGNTDVALRRGWHVVAASDEIGVDPVQVWLLGEPWALVRFPTPDGTSRLAAFAEQPEHLRHVAPLVQGPLGEPGVEVHTDALEVALYRAHRIAVAPLTRLLRRHVVAELRAHACRHLDERGRKRAAPRRLAATAGSRGGRGDVVEKAAQ